MSGIYNGGAPYAGSYTFATLPSAATYSGYRARVSDGVGFDVFSNGTLWAPDGPQLLFRSAIPMGLAPTGTMANNGAVTLGTAIPAIYPSCYLHFPANAIVAGSAAGFYYTVMSSTTVGQVFNNTYTTGVPTIPSSPTAFSTTGPGSFAAVTARTTLITLTLPGGLMGLNGSIDGESLWSATNNANAKTLFFSFGGTDLFPTAATSALVLHDTRVVGNRGSASVQLAQVGSAQGGWSTANTAHGYITVNTASDVTLTWAATKATATDWLGLEFFRLWVSP
jgi:hypothetical protein